MRFSTTFVVCAGLLLAVAGCASQQGGPTRSIAIENDVARVKLLTEPDILDFYALGLDKQASLRNQIVTARMYIADVEYHYYESRLTKEMQQEGMLATAASLGLTTAATLVPVTQTKTLLSALATGVTGLDKAYNEKELLSNTIQALQFQMRADRKTQASVIYAKMFRSGGGNTKIVTPIAEYTLPMALSDADSYYQAGTFASALVGLSKTLANAEQNADQAKSDAGPNPIAVSVAKATASSRPPGAAPGVTVIASVARDVSYISLRAQLFPNGAKTADPELLAYVKTLFAPKNVAIGVILSDARFATLRQRISKCITERGVGAPCAEGSLTAFAQ